MQATFLRTFKLQSVNDQVRIVSKIGLKISISWHTAIWQGFVSFLSLIVPQLYYLYLYIIFDNNLSYHLIILYLI